MAQADGGRIALGNDGRVMVRKNGGRFWSEEAEAVFFDHLAATCNVTTSAKAAGFTTPTVYDHRRRRPEFAAQWQAALEQGYARLEMALLEAANGSIGRRRPNPDHPIPAMTVDQALGVLRAHRLAVRGDGARSGRPARPRRLEDVRESILRKVRAVRAAEEGAATRSAEGGADREA